MTSKAVENIFLSPTLTQAQLEELTREYKSVTTKHGGEEKQLSYLEWKHQTKSYSRTVVIVHGLTRNCRDYDVLAQHLAYHHGYRCLCVDVAGRGESDWLNGEEYGYPAYIADINILFDTLELKDIDFVGTSMGGLIGMFLTGNATHPISKMVMVDVGSYVTGESLRHIATYVGKPHKWKTMEEAREYFQSIYGGVRKFGATPEEVKHFATHSTRWAEDENGDKYLRLHYDLAIGTPFKDDAESLDLSEFWKLVNVPSILVMRGENSDLLTAETVKDMQAIHPQTVEVVVPDCGHAPTLMRESQLEPLTKFLVNTQ